MKEEEEQLKEEKREKKRKCNVAGETAPASKAPKQEKIKACQDGIFAPENAAKLDAASVLDSDIILAESPNQTIVFSPYSQVTSFGPSLILRCWLQSKVQIFVVCGCLHRC